eukprot:TRINITY_DN1529_c0_g1_i1.p1 TRINITY_DN1529_c0_g1~~TRINITY_DN1529_c0_g1_i1.p1  ORF type:complete len:412 (-),score=-15.76 TRINITY_DN1529_c0_g1_i1:42-1277(-)
MSLGYASFSDSAAQELLPMYEKEDQAGFEYRLHDSQQKYQKRSCSNFGGLKERFSGIPPQDEISKKKENLQKWQLLTFSLLFGGVLMGFWGYNATNPIVTISFQNVTALPLPTLTLCIPGPDNPDIYSLRFREYNLTGVQRPGDFTIHSIREDCGKNTPDLVDCETFVEFDGETGRGACFHIGNTGNTSFPWSLKTEGETILSFVVLYPDYITSSVFSLVVPFFGWNTTCTQRNDQPSVLLDQKCTKTKYLIFEEKTQNPFVLYQVVPNQLTLVEVHKEVHVDRHGERAELYPTTFITAPFSNSDLRFFNLVCEQTFGVGSRCNTLLFGFRSLSQTIQTTYEERYPLSIVRSFGTAASLIALISGLCTFMFAFLITKLSFRPKHAHLTQDLREAIIYMYKILSREDQTSYK